MVDRSKKLAGNRFAGAGRTSLALQPEVEYAGHFNGVDAKVESMRRSSTKDALTIIEQALVRHREAAAGVAESVERWFPRGTVIKGRFAGKDRTVVVRGPMHGEVLGLWVTMRDTTSQEKFAACVPTDMEGAEVVFRPGDPEFTGVHEGHETEELRIGMAWPPRTKVNRLASSWPLVYAGEG